MGVPAGFADGLDDNTTYTAGDGLTLSGGEFSVSFAGSGSATSVAHSDHNHLGQTWIGTDNSLEISGSFDTEADPAPLVLSNLTGHGLFINSTDKSGVNVSSAGWDGFRVDWQVVLDFRCSAAYYGVSIGSAGWAGILVNSTEGDGLHINSADDTGVAVVSAGDYGVWAESNNASSEGGHFQNSATGGTGLYAKAGSNTAADLVLGGNNATDDDGRVRSDPAYAGSDLLMVSNDAIQLELDNDNNESGDVWVLNGENATVFVINEAGDMTAIGTKSAAVSTEDYGKRKLYA
jgi:hypothetical protein